MYLKAITRLGILVLLILTGMTLYSKASGGTGCLAQEAQCEGKCGDNGACISNCQAQYLACKSGHGLIKAVLPLVPLEESIATKMADSSSEDLPNLPGQLNAAIPFFYDVPVLRRDHQIRGSTILGIW
ncbi:MAG TPA: hypothetical protein VI636_14450 [Candidatus Angelobacter sp.]